jgi:hypothetical protein
VNDFPEVLKTFHKLCRSSKDFTHFLKLSLEHPVCRGLDLGAFLLSPVQRMPQYILLFKKMIKFTDPSDPDYSDIKLCLDRLRDYLKRLNDSMEHSFQLVTAGMTPHSHHQHNSPDDEESSSPRGDFHRLSISSSQSEGERRESLNGRMRQKSRSKSVPRNQQELSSKVAENKPPAKLKNKSKSHWTVCPNNGNGSSEGRSGSRDYGHHGPVGTYGRILSTPTSQNNPNSSSRKSSRGILSEDSDLDLNPSDIEESSDTEMMRENRRKSSSIATKSLPNFNPQYGRSGSFVSEPNLLDEKSLEGSDLLHPRRVGRGIINEGNNGQRPKSLYENGQGTNSRGRGRGGIMMTPRDRTMCSLGDEGNKSKQRISLRTSLKNIFSLKKRYKSECSECARRYCIRYFEPVLPALSSTSSTDSKNKSPTLDSVALPLPAPELDDDEDLLSPTVTSAATPKGNKSAILPLIRYMHSMPSYLGMVMITVRETTV